MKQSIQKTKIIIAEQDLTLGTVLADVFSSRDYVARACTHADELLEQLATEQYEGCILSTNLTSSNSMDLLNTIRTTYDNLPIILLMDSPTREAILRAYELGCDDYMTKPLSIDILVCKMDALLRRIRLMQYNSETTFILDNQLFDSVRQTFGGRHLSSRESDLLLLLCRQMNQLVDRHQILRLLWRTDDNFASRSLSVYINHLRTIISPTNYRILGVHGKGYKLVSL